MMTNGSICAENERGTEGGNKAWLPSDVEEVLVKCWCRGRKKEERQAKTSERIETARVSCRGYIFVGGG